VRAILSGILILALFAGDLWLLLTRDGHELDYTTYSIIHDGYRAPWLTKSMELASKLGEPKIACYGLVAFGFWGTMPAQLTAKLAAIAMVSSSGIVTLTKYVTNRSRPEGMSPRSNSSFPSGHAAGAAAAAVMVSRRHGRLGAVAWFVALWVMLSRIYLGRHFPSDVLTGALLGSIASWLVLRGERFFEKFHF
jgi:membrane-associated phospholipid phosphatase